MMNLFITSIQFFAWEDINWWTGHISSPSDGTYLLQRITFSVTEDELF